MREVRETNFCRLFAAADEHTGKVLVFSAIDNLWKGTSSQALQNLNLMFGLPETRGAAVSAACGTLRGSRRRATVLRSRWVPAPAHVRDLDAGGLPAGFRAAGVACGHQAERATPTSGCSCATPRQPGQRRALHQLERRRRAGARDAASAAAWSGLRAVLANSGCANAATGGAGLDDAAKTQGAAALAAGVDPRPRWRSPPPGRSATSCRWTRC